MTTSCKKLLFGTVAYFSLIRFCYNFEVKNCLRNNSITCPQCESPAKSLESNCSACTDNKLDQSTNCTQCKCGASDCYTGNFILSVHFYAYLNEQQLCGECRDIGPVCCDTESQTKDCPIPCTNRLLMLIEPYGAPIRDVYLPRQRPDFSDNITFGVNISSSGNITNPYQVQINTWTGYFQFYVVVYDGYGNSTNFFGRFAVDRFAININFGSQVPASIPRRSYVGIHNISKFDLSFSINCSNGFTGPSCNIDSSSDDPNNEIQCSTVAADIPVSTEVTQLISTILAYRELSIAALLVSVTAILLVIALILIIITLQIRHQKKQSTSNKQVNDEVDKTVYGHEEVKVNFIDQVWTESDKNFRGEEVGMDSCLAYEKKASTKMQEYDFIS